MDPLACMRSPPCSFVRVPTSSFRELRAAFHSEIQSGVGERGEADRVLRLQCSGRSRDAARDLNVPACVAVLLLIPS